MYGNLKMIKENYISSFVYLEKLYPKTLHFLFLFFRMVMFKKEKEEVIHLQAHFKKNQKIREYSSHISKVHSVDWSADGSKFSHGIFYFVTIIVLTYSEKKLFYGFRKTFEIRG